MRSASGSRRRWSPLAFAFTHSPRDMSHGRAGGPPALESPVNSSISVWEYGTTSARSSRIRARSTDGVGGPLPPTRRPVWLTVPQSMSAAAREPMDQSMVASMAGEGLALGLLAGCDHRRAPSLALGDAAVGPLLEQLGQDAIERLLVQAHVRVGGGRRGRGCSCLGGWGGFRGRCGGCGGGGCGGFRGGCGGGGCGGFRGRCGGGECGGFR